MSFNLEDKVQILVKGVPYESVVIRLWEATKEVEVFVPDLREKIWRAASKVTLLSAVPPLISESSPTSPVAPTISQTAQFKVGDTVTWKHTKSRKVITDISRINDTTYGGQPTKGVLGFDKGKHMLWLPLEWVTAS